MTSSKPEIIFRLTPTPEGVACWSKIEPKTVQHAEAMAKIARELQLTHASIFPQSAQSKSFNDLRSKSAAHYNKTFKPQVGSSWISALFLRITSAFSRLSEFTANLFRRQISIK